jgi:tRNA 2-selenouridine synthase
MAIQKIDIDTFITKAPNAIVIDVRSPGEYEHAHIPGAYSLPLFTNEERAIVGTTYKKKSREAAIKIALPFFGYKMAEIIDQVEALTKAMKKQHPENVCEIIVHCWRGGMRSGAIAWLLDLYGFKVFQLIGGYKKYRNWVLTIFEKPYAFKVLGGFTGSGKTEILHAIKQQSIAVIDLEDLAKHKGSSFGALGQAAQPTQEMFENKLANALSSIPNETEIWIEDESQRIGTVLIPNTIFTRMRASICYFIDIPFEERLSFIIKAYGIFDQQSLINATLRIQKRLGGLETKNVVNALIEGETGDAFSILLKYYDRWYEKNNHGEKANFKFKVVSLPAEKVDPLQNANIVLASA